jgi:hypothetical protein
MAAGLYDVTFLLTTLTPVASALPVYAYTNAPLGLSAAQVTQFQTTNLAAASGVTDIYGHTQLALPEATLCLFVVGNLMPSYMTTSLTSSSGPVYVSTYEQTPLCEVFGTLQNQDGSAQVNATVTANLIASGPVIATNLILANSVSTTTDANGNWNLSLISNDLITEPKNTLYTFVFSLPINAATANLQPFFPYGQPLAPHGPSISRSVHVPNVASVNFATLV